MRGSTPVRNDPRGQILRQRPGLLEDDPARALDPAQDVAVAGPVQVLLADGPDEDTPHAVVGSQIVREGEKVSGATVVKIDKESVTFEMDGKRWMQTIQH